MTTKNKTQARREMYQRAVLESFIKLNPRWMVRNPVMFVVEVGSLSPPCCGFNPCSGKVKRPRVSSARSRYGCGSLYCSPTSPKPWQKDAARRKRSRLRKAKQDTPAKKVSSNVKTLERENVETEVVSSTASQR
jgi:potassium-transporting ATPase ATP-binding subunit